MRSCGSKSLETFVTDNDDFAASVSVSASVKDGKTMITVANLFCTEDTDTSLESIGKDIPDYAEATLLYADDMHAHNTFEVKTNLLPLLNEISLAFGSVTETEINKSLDSRIISRPARR